MPQPNIFQEAFDKAIKSCGVTATWLAEKSSTSQSNLSKFRKGQRDVYTETLAKYFEGLPYEGKKRFVEELLGEPVTQRKRSLCEVIEGMDIENSAHRKEAANALRLIVSKFIPEDSGTEKPRKNTDELVEVK